MTTKNQKIEVIVPKSNRKYRSLCKKIHRKYNKSYISYDLDDKPIFNLPKLMKILVKHLKPKINKCYCRNTKFKESDFIDGIFNVVHGSMYWSKYNKDWDPNKPSGKYLNKRHNQYVNWGVYDCLYLCVLNRYFSTDKFGKLKYQSIDTTFCTNLYGSEMMGRNVKYKSKNGIKLSVIVDSNGVPFSLSMASGNINDCRIANEHINKPLIDPETSRVKHNNRYTQKMLCDAGYHNSSFYKTLKQKGYDPIIDVNKRNTKDKVKIEKMKVDKMRYIKNSSNRLTVERFNAWIHKFPKITRVVEKTIKSFRGILMLACSVIVSHKIT